LAKLLVEYRGLADGSPEQKRKCNQIYGELTQYSRRAMVSCLRTWSFHSDVCEDAKDLAQIFMLVLLRQEDRKAGIFSPGMAQADLEKYLGATIWNGARQLVKDHLEKLANRGYPVSLNEEGPDGNPIRDIPVKGVDITMKIDAQEFLLRLSAKQDTDALKNAGTTPLKWLLASALEPLANPEMPKRTLQRKIQNIRSQITKGLDGPSL
jgi:hypothetical protein